MELKTKRVQIIMSTYNGEKYIREQLNSIVELDEFEKIALLIRDDGSVDGTTAILEEYSERYGFEIIYGENVGVNHSIWILLEKSEPTCEYFAISDQDDVWLPHKIKLALSYLDVQDPTIPLLFGSLSNIVDEKLTHLGSTVIPKRGVSFFNAMTQNVTPGHTQVFNRVMVNMLLEKGADKIHVIDWWLYLMASAMGKVVFANEFTVLHRQHGINAVGYETRFLKKAINRFRSLHRKKGYSVSDQLYAFYTRYKDVMLDEYYTETEDYFASMGGFLRRGGYAIRCKAYRQQTFENLVFKVLYIFGKYDL